MNLSELDTMKEYHDLFQECFGLNFNYGFKGRFCYVSISRSSSGYDITYAEAYGDDFDECIRHLQKKLCTYGLSPDDFDLGPFPLFNSPSELRMKLELQGE